MALFCWLRSACLDAHDIGIVQEFVEVETGKGFDALERRPVLAAAFAEARRRKCAVLVAKLDRLSRNSAFIGALIERKVPFFVAELGLDVDRFMLHIHAAVGEKEREMIGERTKAALAAARRRGVTRAGKPFTIGNPKIHLARRQAARAARSEADRFALNVAPLIRPLRDQGLTLAEVAQALDARGVATVRGGRGAPVRSTPVSVAPVSWKRACAPLDMIPWYRLTLLRRRGFVSMGPGGVGGGPAGPAKRPPPDLIDCGDAVAVSLD